MKAGARATEVQPATCAVLFADVAGSTRLYETLGDAAALKLVSELLSALRGVATRCGGRVVKNLGDEILCVFPDAAHALRAACDMQLAAGGHCAVRVGLHCGEVLESGGDIFGDTVNTAARVTALGGGWRGVDREKNKTPPPSCFHPLSARRCGRCTALRSGASSPKSCSRKCCGITAPTIRWSTRHWYRPTWAFARSNMADGCSRRTTSP
jgi:hypothetical protein